MNLKTIEEKCYVIAEAGSNHNGDFKLAEKLVIEAGLAGADAIKFQLFSLETLYNKEAFDGITRDDNSKMYEAIKAVEFPMEWLIPLKKVADQCNIDFVCTCFDIERLQEYMKLETGIVKIASGDLTYIPLLEEIAKYDCIKILSTGFGSMAEIDTATKILGDNVFLLSCVPKYPANMCDYVDMDFRKLNGLVQQIGLSDHTESIVLPAVIMRNYNLCVVEKHFTLNKQLPGFDHSFSLNPEEMKYYVRCIRDMENRGNSYDETSEKQKRQIRRSDYNGKWLRPEKYLLTE